MGYDAIIVGAGVGGCAAGAALAGAGKKVLILERMPQVGGRCSSIERDGFILDTGAHAIFSVDYGPIEEACRRVGKAGGIKWHKFKKLIACLSDMKVYWIDDVVTIRMEGYNDIVFNYLDALGRIFQAAPEHSSPGMASDDVVGNLISLVKTFVTPFANLFDYTPCGTFLDSFLRPTIGMATMAIPVGVNIMLGAVPNSDYDSMMAFMTRFISWWRIYDLVNTFQCGMFGSPGWLTSSGELVRTVLNLLNRYQPGMDLRDLAGYPIGGLIRIPMTMCEGILECGGEIRTGVNVERIIIEDDKVLGVETGDGEIIEAPFVISNAGIKETVAFLIGEEYFDKHYAKKIKDLKTGISGFCLRAALDEPVTDLDTGGILLGKPGTMDNYFKQLWTNLTIPDEPPPMYFAVPSNMDPSTAPPGMQLIVGIGCLMYDSKDPYSKMEPLILDGFERTFPGFKEHLLWYDYLDPSTYVALGERLGPAIGLAQCIGQVGADRPSSDMPIEGLYACGGEAGANISGMACEMCIESGLVCGDMVVEAINRL